MTNEELDIARAEEAMRLSRKTGNGCSVVVIAARLAREGWKPPEPDPEVGSIWKQRDYNYRVMAVVGKVGSEKYPRAVVFIATEGVAVLAFRLENWFQDFTFVSPPQEDQDQ